MSGFNVDLRDYQEEASDGVDKNRKNGKRFTGVVSTTGSGKSFIAMHEIDKLTKKIEEEVLKFLREELQVETLDNGKILFIAPTSAIISQFQRHMMNIIDPEGRGKIVEMTSTDESIDDEEAITKNETTKFIKDYLKKSFGLDIEFHCYKYIEGKSDEFIEKLMKNVKLCIFDEAHRAVAKEWEGRVAKMMEVAPDAQFLGITATPDRDSDEKNAMDRLARASGDYSEEEIEKGDHLASDLLLEEAIRDGYVNEPEVFRFDRALDETKEYIELENAINRKGIKHELKKQLEEYKEKIDQAIGKEENQDKEEEFAKLVRENLNPNAKKGIVFIPPFSNKEKYYLDEDTDSVKKREKYIEDYKARINKIFEGTGKKVNFSVVYSALNKDDSEEINKFEEANPNPDEVNIIIAINKLNEGVHITNIDFEISLRPISTNIMFSQQNGRVIHGIKPGTLSYNKEAQIFDRYNNFYNHRHLKEKEPRIEYDARKISEARRFIEKNGRLPDSNSSDIMEARLALNLKRILATNYDDPTRKSNYDEKKVKKYEKLKNEIEETINVLGIKDVAIPDRNKEPSKDEILREGFYDTTDTEKEFLIQINKAKELLNKERITNIKGLFGLTDIIAEEVLKQQKKDITPENINKILFDMIPDYTIDKTDTLGTLLHRVGLDNNEKFLEKIEERFVAHLKKNKIVRSTFIKKDHSITEFKFGEILSNLQNDFISGIETFDEYKPEALAKYRILPSINKNIANINFSNIMNYLTENGKNPNFYITVEPPGFIIPRSNRDSMSDVYYGINIETLTNYSGDPTGKDPNYKRI